ncbi:hypothetical protein VOLCADRAFT_87595 [Volvox carteri f. nagariensis]|uniref:Uncharacterized protein n=1 Tax=Volvox carteri f. nagariensis TaxID=3068 RepID=D8TLQ8_VOLCA|nr:uncharacterized protein VOLCADRAFT_87595 [Volvox carteri f. nagariensis]EFJ51371.1 hypothetical protein VOLCADRAFT_87595 [Volvox carteri f. nagariensis]|eukprot:XP_002947323.1 hypothetical protein VOLCADRAFT_87595 [Volvox carteri f. nagariensis]
MPCCCNGSIECHVENNLSNKSETADVKGCDEQPTCTSIVWADGRGRPTVQLSLKCATRRDWAQQQQQPQATRPTRSPPQPLPYSVPTLAIGDVFLSCNTVAGLEHAADWDLAKAPLEPQAQAQASTQAKLPQAPHQPHSAFPDGPRGAAAPLDLGSELLLRMSPPVGGQRLMFVSKEGAELVRRALLLSRYDEIMAERKAAAQEATEDEGIENPQNAAATSRAAAAATTFAKGSSEARDPRVSGFDGLRAAGGARGGSEGRGDEEVGSAPPPAQWFRRSNTNTADRAPTRTSPSSAPAAKSLENLNSNSSLKSNAPDAPASEALLSGNSAETSTAAAAAAASTYDTLQLDLPSWLPQPIREAATAAARGVGNWMTHGIGGGGGGNAAAASGGAVGSLTALLARGAASDALDVSSGPRPRLPAPPLTRAMQLPPLPPPPPTPPTEDPDKAHLDNEEILRELKQLEAAKVIADAEALLKSLKRGAWGSGGDTDSSDGTAGGFLPPFSFSSYVARLPLAAALKALLSKPANAPTTTTTTTTTQAAAAEHAAAGSVPVRRRFLLVPDSADEQAVMGSREIERLVADVDASASAAAAAAVAAREDEDGPSVVGLDDGASVAEGGTAGAAGSTRSSSRGSGGSVPGRRKTPRPRQLASALALVRDAGVAAWRWQRSAARWRVVSALDVLTVHSAGFPIMRFPPVSSSSSAGAAGGGGGGGAGSNGGNGDEDSDDGLPEAKELLREMGAGNRRSSSADALAAAAAAAAAAAPAPSGPLGVLSTLAVGVVSFSAWCVASAVDVWDDIYSRTPWGLEAIGVPQHVNVRPTYLEEHVQRLAEANAPAVAAAAAAVRSRAVQRALDKRARRRQQAQQAQQQEQPQPQQVPADTSKGEKLLPGGGDGPAATVVTAAATAGNQCPEAAAATSGAPEPVSSSRTPAPSAGTADATAAAGTENDDGSTAAAAKRQDRSSQRRRGRAAVAAAAAAAASAAFTGLSLQTETMAGLTVLLQFAWATARAAHFRVQREADVVFGAYGSGGGGDGVDGLLRLAGGRGSRDGGSGGFAAAAGGGSGLTLTASQDGELGLVTRPHKFEVGLHLNVRKLLGDLPEDAPDQLLKLQQPMAGSVMQPAGGAAAAAAVGGGASGGSSRRAPAPAPMPEAHGLLLIGDLGLEEFEEMRGMRPPALGFADLGELLPPPGRRPGLAAAASPGRMGVHAGGAGFGDDSLEGEEEEEEDDGSGPESWTGSRGFSQNALFRVRCWRLERVHVSVPGAPGAPLWSVVLVKRKRKRVLRPNNMSAILTLSDQRLLVKALHKAQCSNSRDGALTPGGGERN